MFNQYQGSRLSLKNGKSGFLMVDDEVDRFCFVSEAATLAASPTQGEYSPQLSSDDGAASSVLSVLFLLMSAAAPDGEDSTSFVMEGV